MGVRPLDAGTHITLQAKLKVASTIPATVKSVKLSVTTKGSSLPTTTRTTSKTILRYHTVKNNESLWTLAKTYYGKGSLWTKIRDANVKVFKTLKALPHIIYHGWKLLVP